LRLRLGGPRLAAYERQRVYARVALWTGEPQAALDWVEQSLARFRGTEIELFCGEFLALGARAVADLAERARAGGDADSERDAGAARERLISALEQMNGRPLGDHAYPATVPGDRADWASELLRSVGQSDPSAWQEAAATWQRLGRPHRAAYALWRQAQALLDGPAPAAAAAEPLQAAAVAAHGMVPLLNAIHRLAVRARVAVPAGADSTPRHPTEQYGLTKREGVVLRLMTEGYTNSQIGAELFMSPKTASVHVTNILRKLNAANRTEAAAIALRAGLVRSPED
jgi:DNA-binding CsgD family transcriptional regulator